jgi:hypothetical protein
VRLASPVFVSLPDVSAAAFTPCQLARPSVGCDGLMESTSVPTGNGVKVQYSTVPAWHVTSNYEQ